MRCSAISRRAPRTMSWASSAPDAPPSCCLPRYATGSSMASTSRTRTRWCGCSTAAGRRGRQLRRPRQAARGRRGSAGRDPDQRAAAAPAGPAVRRSLARGWSTSAPTACSRARRGMYRKATCPTPTDLYGRSKLLGRGRLSAHAMTLRTSIIGHELAGARSLVGWFLAQAGRGAGLRAGDLLRPADRRAGAGDARLRAAAAGPARPLPCVGRADRQATSCWR